LPSADSRRSVVTCASTPSKLPLGFGVSALGLTCSVLAVLVCAGMTSHLHLPAQPSLAGALLTPAPAAHAPGHLGTMRALTPAPLRQRSRSLRSIRLPSRHPVPNHAMQPSGHVPITSCRRSAVTPGFAMNEQARHCTPPNRVRPPTGCRFASGCSPPRLAATQLPSATCAVTSHGTDSHYADNAN
jgi:hypothetical protein